MTAVPLSQPYIPKTMGHMVWVCGTAVAWFGTLVKLSLKNKDLALLCGTALGTVSLVFGAFQLSHSDREGIGRGIQNEWPARNRLRSRQHD